MQKQIIMLGLLVAAGNIDAADAGPAKQPPVSPRTAELNRYGTDNTPDYTLVRRRIDWPDENFLNKYFLLKKNDTTTDSYRLEVHSQVNSKVHSVESIAILDLEKGKEEYRPWGIARVALTIKEVAPDTKGSTEIDKKTGIVISVLGSGLELIGPKCYVFSPQTPTGETTSRTQEVAAEPRLDVAEHIRKKILPDVATIKKVVARLWRDGKRHAQAETK